MRRRHKLWYSAPADRSWLPSGCDPWHAVFVVQFEGLYLGDESKAWEVGRREGLSDRAVLAVLHHLIRIAKHKTLRRVSPP
jgi:hypothetical protein